VARHLFGFIVSGLDQVHDPHAQPDAGENSNKEN
jgi:hypothetical protein